MDQTNLVQEVHIEVCNRKYTATYFIEGAVIHAVVDDRRYRLPVGTASAEATVRSFVAEHVCRDTQRAGLPETR